ncbi:hypothetical protein HUG10_13895 [Halorarum halophilum]|uniref:Chlor_Arch_YYY domain-containing protein n=1 Tax=Halorarum halophilum TaxID=2743090 RepID=A0A7D5GGQ0_9EURY|nr:DUF2298 domain-containing protein [Halobaculum halophilum]QLG28570.1 hypothetical protein HUG10_13895 [Halobaculum halophilum]
MEYGLVATWLVAYAALAALGLPLAARLFPDSASRGAGFALPLSLLVMGVVSFWVGHLAFGLPALLLSLLVLVGLSALAAFDRDALRAGEFEPAVAVNRTAIRNAAVVFLASFAFLVAVRAVDPAVVAGGGEKFLDFGLLNSLLRAEVLPPRDMWFAGEPVRYYYGGHLLTALLAMLTGTSAEFAYNLALAGFYAMLVTAAFDLAGNVAAARGLDRRVAGGLAAFFTGLAANVTTGGWVLFNALPAGVQTSLGETLGFDPAEHTTREFSYWTASRVIEGTINEFPLFAWLNGDLHAHMTDTPFLLLAAALAFALYRAGATADEVDGTAADGSGVDADATAADATVGATAVADPTAYSGVTRRRLLLFGVVPVVGGFQAVVNTWSFPSVFGVVWLGLTFAHAPPWTLLPGAAGKWVDRATNDSRLAAELARPVVAGALVAGAAALAVLLAVPFLYGIATSGGGTRTLELLTLEMRSGLPGLLGVHGAFLVTFGAYLFGRVGTDRPLELAAALVGFVAVALAIDFPALALLLPLLVVAWAALRTDRAGFETVLVVAGAGLVLLVEVVYLNEQAGPGRMNTVFKTYAQVWPLWATALGVVLASFLGPVSRPSVWPSREARRDVAAVFVAVLIVTTGMYAALALPAHFDGGPPDGPTLDATQFVETYHPEEAPAIGYLDERDGQPVILSAPATTAYPGADPLYGHGPGMYQWEASPAASLTGVQTVAGWHHEVGYRGPDAYFDRVREVDDAYTERSRTVAVLRKYDVRYVWVGPGEEIRYGDDAVAFGEIPGIEPVVETPKVTLYRVDQEQLPE